MTKEEFCGAVKQYEPISFAMVKAYGAPATILFAHLLNVCTMHGDSDGWFFSSQKQIEDAIGMQRRQTEAAINTLAEAGILTVATKPKDQKRYFAICVNGEQLAQKISEILDALDQPKQTPVRALKAPQKPKQAAITANAEPVGISEQLAPVVKPVKQKPEFTDAAAVRLVEHLNAVAGTAFRSNAKGNVDKFARVLKSKEGTEEEVRMVIEFKTLRWGNDPVMRAYLTPETLSRPSKFPGYLEEAYNAKGKQIRPTGVTDLVPLQTDTVAIMLPSGQQFGGYFEKKDQRKVDMVKAVLLAHPGIEEHLDPRLGMPAYLAGMRDIDLQTELKKAKSIYNTVNYKNPFWI
jgi:uncharacterized phage protein (TIGR02220 family)